MATYLLQDWIRQATSYFQLIWGDLEGIKPRPFELIPQATYSLPGKQTQLIFRLPLAVSNPLPWSSCGTLLPVDSFRS